MNKKVLGIVIAVVLAVLIAGVAVMKSKGIKPLKGVEAIIKPSVELDSPAQYIPNNAIMLYSVSDLRGIWEVIKTSQFWSQFTKLKVLTDFAIKENLSKLLASFEEKAGMEITESRVMDLLGNRLVVSVLFDPQTNDVKLMLQSYVGKTTQFVEGIIKSLPQSAGIQAVKVEYEGESIMTIIPEITDNAAETTEIRYVLVNNILTLAFGKAEQDLKKVIELIKGKSKDKLYNEKSYQDILDKLAGDEDGVSTYYSDFTKIHGKLQQILQPLMDASPEQFANINMDELNKNMAQLKGIAGKVVRTKEGLAASSFIIPNFEKMTDEQKADWNKAVKPLGSLRFAPEDAILYSATGTINAKATWKTMMAAANAPAAPADPNAAAEAPETPPNPMASLLDTIKELEKGLGISVENDILSLVDNEFSFIFSGIALDSPVPIPRLGFIVKSTNASGLKEKFKMIIEKTLAGENAPIQITFENKSIEGMDTTVIKTPLGEAFSPVLVTVDSWVMLASNAVVAEKMIKTYKGSLNGLDKTDSFKAYSGEFSKAAQFSYGNLQASVGMIAEVLGWVIQRKDLIPQMEQVKGIITNVTTYAIPVIECFKVLNNMAFTTCNEGDVSKQEVYVKISDLK